MSDAEQTELEVLSKSPKTDTPPTQRFRLQSPILLTLEVGQKSGHTQMCVVNLNFSPHR